MVEHWNILGIVDYGIVELDLGVSTLMEAFYCYCWIYHGFVFTYIHILCLLCTLLVVYIQVASHIDK